MYVRIEAIVDTNGQKIAPFLKDTEDAFSAQPPCAVIVDLRGDGGGDYTNMWHFAHALRDLMAHGDPRRAHRCGNVLCRHHVDGVYEGCRRQPGHHHRRTCRRPAGVLRRGRQRHAAQLEILRELRDRETRLRESVPRLARLFLAELALSRARGHAAADIDAPARFADWAAGHDVAPSKTRSHWRTGKPRGTEAAVFITAK